MSDKRQPQLIEGEDTAPLNEKQANISSDASIQAALGEFENYMRDEGFALNTCKAFASDVRLLGKYLGIGQPVGEIGTKNLNDFLDWLLNERGIPCSPKSYARRVTTLKVFFGWLYETGVINDDPSTAVIQRSVKSPLPKLPTEDELARVEAVTQAVRAGGGSKKADARPHLLFTLLLQTAIKKTEAMNMVPNHIDRSNPDRPMLFIRYANPRLRYKERKVELTPEWLDVLDEYMVQYSPPDTVFTCTPRNLEYILRDMADAAGVDRGLISFENLRWCSAIRDHKNGVEQDDIRQKLGLSKITWRDTRIKLEKLIQEEKDGFRKD
jgi:site-specific recombinase XerD